MIEYIIRRLLLVFPVVLGVSLLVFFMIHLIPGDPVTLMLGESAQSADIETLRKELQLDQPLTIQFMSFMKGLLTLDLGHSLHRRVSVVQILLERIPATIELTLVSMIAALLIAMPLGILSAVRVNSLFDTGAMFFALLGVSLPNFWLGPVLILYLSVHLDLLPVSGRLGWSSYILPAVTLGTSLAAILTRMIRSSLLEVLTAQYVVTAYAKGVSRSKVIIKHALRNALIPVVTIIGLQFGALLGGSVITETIFSWPGIGRELIKAIQGRDFPVVQGCVLLISFSYVFVNLITDLTYGFLDPRIQYTVKRFSFWEIMLQGARSLRSFARWFPGNIVSIGVIALIVISPVYFDCTKRLSLIIGEWGSMIDPIGSNGHSMGLWKTGIFWVIKTSILLIPFIMLYIWHRQDPLSSRKFFRNPTALISLGIILLFLFIGIFGPDLAPQDPSEQNLGLRLRSPGLDHWFGTDHLGRDLFSRILTGARISLYVGLIVTLISSCMGITIGMISGLFGGWIDDVIMRVVDVLLAFPGILLAIALVSVLGPDINNVIIALCLMGWVGYARLARGQVLGVKEEEYVLAARALGVGSIRIMFRHLLPNILAPLIIQATLGMAGVIIAEAGLSFLGLGVQPPTPSWGGILNAGVDYFRTGAHITLFPGLAIMVVVMGFNFLGDGLRDALDPKHASQC